MRRSWIKIETNTPDKPEICIMASQLRMDADAVMGKLIRVWSWAELNISDRNESNVTTEFLDKVAGKKGFSAALEKAGWLQRKEEILVFPNFDRHNGQAAKGRAQTALRVSKHRKRKGEVAILSVDEQLEARSINPEKEANIQQDISSVKGVQNDDNTQTNNELSIIKDSIITADKLTKVTTLSNALTPDSSPQPIVISETVFDGIPQASINESDAATGKLSRAAKKDKLAGQPLLF